jgi:Domain of unknown function (DUF4157)
MTSTPRIVVNALLTRPTEGELPRGWTRLPEELCRKLAPYYPGLDLRRDVVWRVTGVPWLFRTFSFVKPIGITLGTLVCLEPEYYRPDTDLGLNLVAHELTHVEQYRAHGYLPFTIRYAWEFVFNLLRGNSPHAAYEKIGFEVEARARADRVVAEWVW